MARRTLTLVLLVGLAGCGHSTSGGAASATATGPGSAASANHAAGARSVTAARTTAQTEFGLLAGGDYGGAWDLWSDAAKKQLSRADFLALNRTCPPKLGTAVQITGVGEVDQNTVQVVWTGGTARLVYAGDKWTFQPDQAALDRYAQRLRGTC
jgi:hypothetical protein